MVGEDAGPYAPYFVALAVENLRCFREAQALLLSRDGAPARWTVLYGEAGTGKTTLLQMIATLRPRFRAADAPGAVPSLDAADWPGLHWTRRSGGDEHASLSLVVAFRRSLTGETALVDGLAQSYPAQGPAVVERNLLSPGLGALWPCTTLVLGYGAHRRLHVGRPLPPPTLATNVAHLFDSDAPLIPCEEWLIDKTEAMERFAVGSPERARERERLHRVRSLLCAAVPEIENLEVVEGAGDEGAEVLATTAYGRVALTRLGSTAQSTLAWLADLCARMTAHYAASADPLAQPAVVLVDEIDLHVTEQRAGALIACLAEHLPNVQWVVSTKSAALVKTIPEDERQLAVLRRDGARVAVDNSGAGEPEA